MREDQEYNVRFVKCVERHRTVYDFSLADYTNKEKQELAWKDIAAEMESSAVDCKERWRNLRGSLTRHLKLLSRKAHKAGKHKPYYLTEHMQFIIPYTKTRSRAVLPFIEDNLDPDSIIFNHKHHEEEDDVDEGLELIVRSALMQSPNADVDVREVTNLLHVAYMVRRKERPVLPKSRQDTFVKVPPPPTVVVAGKRSCSPDGESSDSVLKLKRPREDADSDPDLNFFTSVLPDVRCMNPGQKRQFRMGILKLIDEILT